jgi:flagellar biosynthesis/type III secretory pathway protein FliH
MVIRPASASNRAGRVVDTSQSNVSVRPAQLDRPLRRLSLDPTYTDPHLEELVRVAADRAREAARAEGYAAGWSQGRQAAGERAQLALEQAGEQMDAERHVAGQKVAQLMSTLGDAARAARVAAAPEWAEVADTLAEGALRLAAAALGRELRSFDDSLAQSVKVALQKLSEPGEAVVHLNPADAAMVLDDPELNVRVISDPGVPVGSVVMLTPAQRLRYDLPTALAAAEEVLRG